ncbi:MAG: type II toxin-antitoxin system RelE/ParE family toxin [Candidatus Thiodiazotropha sp. (ex Dulcina madagascariensis)]|nr:type II toxin-antitoxin system RelE/ParE family toxin [Candidatus Thiodiazotropha sp. (ex Dulcina madagascariensis)]
MIVSFKRKGLKKFFESGGTAGIQAAHSTKIRDRLTFLHSATCIEDMDLPGYRLHALKGKLAGHWAINVSGNWRIVFKLENGDAYVVNYEDYR